MALTWDKATFDEFYNLSGEIWGHYPGGIQKGIRLGYNYHVIGGPSATDRANSLKNNLSIADGASVLHVGSGFGWTLEGYARIGINAAGFDTSNYIAKNLNVSEEDELRPRIKAAGRDPDDYMILGPPSRVQEYLEDFRVFDENGKPIKEPPSLETNAEGYKINMSALPSSWPTGKNGWLMPNRPTDVLDLSTKPDHGTGWVDTPHPDGQGSHIWSAPILDCYLRERSGLSPRTSAKVIQEDAGTNGSRSSIGRLLGDRFAFIISEHVLTALTDDEALALGANMQRLNERFGGQMIHLVSPVVRDPNPLLNYKTLDQWKALFVANGLIAHKFAKHWGRFMV